MVPVGYMPWGTFLLDSLTKASFTRQLRGFRSQSTGSSDAENRFQPSNGEVVLLVINGAMRARHKSILGYFTAGPVGFEPTTSASLALYSLEGCHAIRIPLSLICATGPTDD